MEEKKDYPMCCGEMMALLYAYTKEGRIFRVFQCNSCFRIEEGEGKTMATFTEEEK